MYLYTTPLDKHTHTFSSMVILCYTHFGIYQRTGDEQKVKCADKQQKHIINIT